MLGPPGFRLRHTALKPYLKTPVYSVKYFTPRRPVPLQRRRDVRLDALERPEALPYAQAQEAQHSSADLVIDGAEIFQEALEHVQPVSEVLDAHHLSRTPGLWLGLG